LILLFSTFFYFDRALYFVPLIFISVYFFTYFSLIEGIESMSWFGLFIMPEAVAISFYLFYFLFPGRWLTRLPFLIFFEISFYAVLLCSNIFNVGVEKNLGLYRAAFSINLFYQAVVSFLLFNLIFALRTNFLLNGLLAGIVTLLFSLNLFWTIHLKKYLEEDVKRYTVFLAVVSFQLALLISFVPLKNTAYSLFMTASYYSLAGLSYNFINQRLFKETIREYALVFVFVLIITALSVSW
jgi:hypothetical protein